MTFKMVQYDQSYYDTLRTTIRNTFKTLGPGYSWTIERLNFARSMARTFNGTTLDQWEKEILLFLGENDQLEAWICSEGENKGEVFFNRTFEEPTKEQVEVWFDASEKYLGKKTASEQLWKLRIREGDSIVEAEAHKRGFVKTAYKEALSEWIMEKPHAVSLPEGWRIATGHEVSSAQKAEAHGLAFGYWHRPEMHEISERGYSLMKEEPDYDDRTDCYLLSETGQVVAFCCIWMDPENALGILEPVGTLEAYHGKGYGRLVVESAMNKAFELNIRRFHVGTDKGFYLSIGFKCLYYVPIWEKRVCL